MKLDLNLISLISYEAFNTFEKKYILIELIFILTFQT